MSAVQAKLHAVAKKEELKILCGNLLLQACERGEERACGRTEGRMDYCRCRLTVPIGHRKG